jgi:hypothetical protein
MNLPFQDSVVATGIVHCLTGWIKSAAQHGTRRIGFAHPPPRIIPRIRFAHPANRRQERIGFAEYPTGGAHTNRIRRMSNWFGEGESGKRPNDKASAVALEGWINTPRRHSPDISAENHPDRVVGRKRLLGRRTDRARAVAHGGDYRERFVYGRRVFLRAADP